LGYGNFMLQTQPTAELQGFHTLNVYRENIFSYNSVFYKIY
jgi:hypothetical protein